MQFEADKQSAIEQGYTEEQAIQYAESEAVKAAQNIDPEGGSSPATTKVESTSKKATKPAAGPTNTPST